MNFVTAKGMKHGDVSPFRQLDAERVAGAGAGIIACQPDAQVAGLYTNNRVEARIETFAAMEDLEAERILLDVGAAPGECLFHDVAQKAAQAGAGVELRTFDRPINGRPYRFWS